LTCGFIALPRACWLTNSVIRHSENVNTFLATNDSLGLPVFSNMPTNTGVLTAAAACAPPSAHSAVRGISAPGD
jgi:hypothetical protein